MFVRNINHTLYLWDKFNDNKIIGDETAYIFTKNISYQPKSFRRIIDDISAEFSDDTVQELIQQDAKAFLEKLEAAGLVISGESEDECKCKALSFCYNSDITARDYVSESHQDDFYSFLKTPALIQIMAEITKICNERCLHCYIPHDDKTTYISYSDIVNIIQQCKEIGTVAEFKISGGECMTHPDFKKIIRQIKDEGFALSLLTNLTLLDDETLEILKEGTLSSVQVSLFSLNAAIHDKITTKAGSLDITLKNLKKLKDANIPVSIATQIMELNKDSIEDMFKYCKENGFRFLCDWTIVARENGTTDNLEYRVKDISLYEKFCKTRMKYDPVFEKEMKDLLALPLKEPDTHLCNAGMNCLQIDSEMNVHPCPGWDVILGNLKTSSLNDIWNNSPILNKIRNTVLKDFKKCSVCVNRNICHICMAEAYNENNSNYEMPEYECQIKNVIRNTIIKS